MHPRSARFVRAALLGGGLLFAVSTPAHAQFGKLKKMGADAIKDATKGKVSEKKAEAKGAVAPGAKAESVPVLTEDGVALVVASLLPYAKTAQIELDLKNARAKADAARAAHEPVKEAEATCREKAEADMEKMAQDPMKMMARAQASDAKRKALDTQSKGVQARLKAATAAGDMRRAAYLQDTLTVLSLRSTMLMYAPNCTVSFMPAAIVEEQYLRIEADKSNSQFDPGAAVKGVMTKREFGIARERIAIWAIMQDEPMKAGPYGVFTPAEEAALKANAADIRKLTPLFKSGAIAWTQWYDLPDWDKD